MGTMVALGDKLCTGDRLHGGNLARPAHQLSRRRHAAEADRRACVRCVAYGFHPARAGVFTGIMQNSGMLKAMAQAAVAFVPAARAKFMPIVLGVLSMPLSLLFDPDSFYFGVLPSSPRWAASLACRRCSSPRPRCSTK
jgi:citrate-Mg2+:H+ or citrate-Ca2+:H+ symporter, CitMHS family